MDEVTTVTNEDGTVHQITTQTHNGTVRVDNISAPPASPAIPAETNKRHIQGA